MRILLLVSFFIVCTNGLWSNKCKEAETSDDKVVKFIQNANCTITDGSRKIKEKLKSVGQHLQGKFESLQEKVGNLKEKLGWKIKTESGELDFGIDVRSFKEDNVIEATSDRSRRSVDGEENEDGGEGNEGENPPESTSESTDETENSTPLEIGFLRILIARDKCKSNNRLIGGNCRELANFD